MEKLPFKILIVDDQQYDLQLMLNCLFEGGYLNTICCTSGKETINIAQKELPDLIIIDWDIPEISGVEVIRLLKKNDITKNIPMIITTGAMMSSSDLKYALETGASDYIRKPFEKIELLARAKSSIDFSILLKNIKLQNIKITKQKDDLINRELRLKTLIDATSEAIVFLENDTITEVSSRFIDYTGFSYKDLIGKSVMSLVIPEDRHLLLKIVNEEEHFAGLSFLTNAQKYIPCEVHMHPFKTNGNHIKVLSILHIKESNTSYDCKNLKICSALKTENEQLKAENTCLRRKLEHSTLKLYQLNEFLNKILSNIKKLKASSSSSDNLLHTEFNSIINCINTNIHDKIWDELKLRIIDVHPQYFSTLLNRYPSLTETDLRILAFIKLNLSTKEIAEITCQQMNTIKAARKRIRQKLKLEDSSVSLISFLAKF